MNRWMNLVVVLLVAFAGGLALAQEGSVSDPTTTSPPTPGSDTEPSFISPEAEIEAKVEEKVQELAQQVDQNEQAQIASAGILKQIYLLAERLSFPLFHAIAFALMVAGVVSYALQLTLGKLFVLARMSLSPTEILSDAKGLAISLVGLVLTTQAAAQNSTFTQSPAAVLTSTTAGAAVGYLFYRWGKLQELQAADGRKVVPPPSDSAKK
ncbi:MAG: hypothetical protein DWH91_02860 [Planctomycetota bacterium]|nr:MAG: hypothetical protein DWH91_02860 [Planctomycetota bacterium]